MAKKDDKPTKYPYSRLKGLQQFFTCVCVEERDFNPSKIDVELFKTLEMAKGKEREAVAALKFLGVIDGDGQPTNKLASLRQDYQGTLQDLLRTAYAELFNRIPVRMMTQSRLVKFFGGKVETAEYQAKLFVWLCQQAGIELPNVEAKFHRARFNGKEEGEEDETDS